MNMADNAARKKAQDEAKKAMEAHREERAQATAEAVKRMEAKQPTQTQEEKDLAKLGIAGDEKQDDGSGETVIEKRVVANQPLGPGGYETRAATPKDKPKKEW